MLRSRSRLLHQSVWHPTLGTRPVSSVGLATNWRLSTIDNQTHPDWSFDRQRFLYGRLSICFSSCIFHSRIFHSRIFSAPVCAPVCMSVRWAHEWGVQKRLNRSRCCLRADLCIRCGLDPPREGALLTKDMSWPIVTYIRMTNSLRLPSTRGGRFAAARDNKRRCGLLPNYFIHLFLIQFYLIGTCFLHISD